MVLHIVLFAFQLMFALCVWICYLIFSLARALWPLLKDFNIYELFHSQTLITRSEHVSTIYTTESHAKEAQSGGLSTSRPKSGFKKVVSFADPQTMVTFIVGKPKQVFFVHKNAACAHSLFFKAAFESKMIEGSTQTMHLEDVDVKAFGRLVDWIYNKDVSGFDPIQTSLQDMILGPYTNNDKCDLYTNIWKLAERTMMPGLQNAAMSQLHSHFEKPRKDDIIRLSHIAFQDENDTVLKKLAIYHALEVLTSATFSKIARLLPVEMTCAIAEEYKGRELTMVTISGSRNEKGAAN
ncbi:hypothetical protein VTL71DRAFT_4506 [Oculimacula yallundae]|uniref:BTB domain-containing protein n=1 Tax=Oculimacula yallundae TaxID=86028 RepID=A0ABR4C284_9HELO